jgi:hypothetical protein
MKTKSWITISLLAIVLLLASVISLKIVNAANAKLRFISEVTELGPDNVIGQKFKVAVVIENVSDLYGFDIQINWTTDYIHYVSHNTTVPVETYPTPIPPSPYGGALHETIIKVKDVVKESKSIPDANPQAMAWFTYASMAPAEPQNGNATMVVFEFEVVDQPFMMNTTIVIHFVETAISNSEGTPIAHDPIDLEIPLYGTVPSTKVKAISDVEELGPKDVVGQKFKIAVAIENVTDLYGFDIQINWTTDYIHYVSHNTTVPVETYPTPIPPSPYGGALHETIIKVKDVVNESKGIPDADPQAMAWFAYASMAPAASQNGSATVVVFTFEVTNQPLMPINTTFILHFIATALSNSTAQPILHIATDLEIPLYGRPQPLGPTLKIDPKPYIYEGPTPHTFGVNISMYNLDEYWDMGGFDIKLYFDPRFAQAIEIIEGKFLADYNFTWKIKSEFNNTEGIVWLAYTQYPSETHTIPSGNTTLFTITFTAKTCSALRFIIRSDTGLAGYAHPERAEPPYNNSETAIVIPYTPIDGFVNIIAVNDHTVTVNAVDYTITTRSNSSVEEVVSYAPVPMLSFTVEGLEEFEGFCNVTIPKTLMWSTMENGWYVLVDGQPVTAQITEGDDKTYIYFTYEQSMHYVTIATTNAVPEIGSLPAILFILAALAIATLLLPKIAKRKNI